MPICPANSINSLKHDRPQGATVFETTYGSGHHSSNRANDVHAGDETVSYLRAEVVLTEARNGNMQKCFGRGRRSAIFDLPFGGRHRSAQATC